MAERRYAARLAPRYPNLAFKANSFWEGSADLLPLVIGKRRGTRKQADLSTRPR